MSQNPSGSPPLHSQQQKRERSLKIQWIASGPPDSRTAAGRWLLWFGIVAAVGGIIVTIGIGKGWF